MGERMRLLAGVFSVLLALPQVAEAKGLTLTQVKSLLTDLGYEPTDHDDNRVSIDDQGQFKRDIEFVLNDDMTMLNIYAPLSEITDEKRPAMPLEALLRGNDTIGPFKYAIVTAAGKDRLDLEGYFDTATVNKPMLRRTIDALLAAENGGESSWGDSHWVAAADTGSALKSLVAARADYYAAWERSPLKLDHVTFVSESPTSFGAYTARSNATFNSGDTITTYLEPVCYTWKSTEDGMKLTAISLDLVVSGKDGEVILDKRDLLEKSFKTHDKFTSLYLDVDLNLKGLPPGEYQMRYTLHDKNSDKSAEATMAFKMAE